MIKKLTRMITLLKEVNHINQLANEAWTITQRSKLDEIQTTGVRCRLSDICGKLAKYVD